LNKLQKIAELSKKASRILSTTSSKIKSKVLKYAAIQIKKNTAKIENEWMIRLTNDIFEGWTYLFPLIHGMLSSFLVNFFTVDEKLHHKLFLLDIKRTSSRVKQQ